MRHLITGAGSGIGQAVARLLHQRGDELVLLARSPERAADLGRDFPGAQILVADLSEPGTLNGIGREIEGGLDGVIHSAGVVEIGPVERLRLADLETQLAVNLMSPAVLTRELLPHLRAARGTLVLVNSTSGLQANPGWASYAASKFGLRGFADAVRAEEAEHGVRVTSVFPSRTATAMQEQVHEAEGKEYDAEAFMSAESVARAIVSVLDLPPDITQTDLTLRSRA